MPGCLHVHVPTSGERWGRLASPVFVGGVGVLPVHHASLCALAPQDASFVPCACVSQYPFHVYLNFVPVGWLPEIGCLR